MTQGRLLVGAALDRIMVCAAVIVAVCLLLIGRPNSLQAQVDPRGATRTLHTAHLRVHVKAGQEMLGRRVAAIGERAWAQLAEELVAPRGPVDVLVAGNADYSNGFAQAFPTNRIVIYDVPPVGSTELRFHDDWLQLVITHELAHIFHLDRATGIWRVGRAIFGRNTLLFPNAYTPSWVKEGLAVHYETLLTGSGRLASTEARTVARSAARDGELPSPDRWSRETTRFPQGQTVYAYGALLMDRAARTGGDNGMRRFVEETARHPIPFLLNRSSRKAFGTSFADQFAAIRDSLATLASAMDTSGDARWTTIANRGWFAEAPRWISNDSLLWAASNGREVPGVYTADVRRPRQVSRVAQRNGLGVNVPMGGDTTLFAQLEFRNPYEVRSDLYRGIGGREERLTAGARLAQPDARADGTIVAIELMSTSTRLVQLAPGGARRVLQEQNIWAEPRWSRAGDRIAAIEFLPTGEQRVVVMDSTGHVLAIVAGGRAVFASPSFTPDGERLVWSSDRSGRMQLETALVGETADTLTWRTERAGVRQASQVTTGIYQPTVSPDGRLVAALRYRVDGYHLAVAPLDTTGPMARGGVYEAVNPVGRARDADTLATGTFVRYNPIRQLLPRYWLPQVGTGREGQVTVGASTSSVDIMERHEWSAQALVNVNNGEVDAAGAYRFRGLGVPVLDISASQAWDGTFRVADSSNVTQGFVARRRRFATLASTWSRPRYRLSLSGIFGAQYEIRDFSAAIDSLLGEPGSLLRRGTRYPSAFVGATMSSARKSASGVSVEEGITMSGTSTFRWREDQPSLGSWRHIGTARGYLPLNVPGFARHVVVARVAGATADDNTQSEFAVGGVSGIRVELLPGVMVGDPGRTFPVRGVAPGVQRGTRAVGGSLEYRAPLVLLRRAPGPFTVFLDRLSITGFTDAARAWCPASVRSRSSFLCEAAGSNEGWIASAGAELVVDLALQYDQPYRLRIGGAVPYAAPAGQARGGAFYVTLGSFF